LLAIVYSMTQRPAAEVGLPEPGEPVLAESIEGESASKANLPGGGTNENAEVRQIPGAQLPLKAAAPGGSNPPSPAAPYGSPAEERQNFAVMSWHSVLMRTGWIFKTESIVMPAMLDALSGAAWIRGFLPMLNRFGQSVPPLLAAGYVRGVPYKKTALVMSSLGMGLSFLALSALWLVKDTLPLLLVTVAILGLYALFFALTGVNQLITSTLTGKVIPVQRRGQLMQFSSSLGSVVAVSCAWVLLSWWLRPDGGNFAAVFAFAGGLFVIAGAVAWWFREQADEPRTEVFEPRRLVGDAWSTLREDANFRRLAVIAALFGAMMTLFPHYQDVGRTRLGLGLDSLVPWIIAQNIGVAAFSLPAGWIADRVGNRRVLKWLMAGLCLVPVLALVLSSNNGLGQRWFWLVFAFLGLSPVAIRTFNNYTLELVERPDHPRYLAMLNLAMAGPGILASLLVGAAIDLFGYEPTFSVIVVFQFMGYLLCFRLIEPRRRHPHGVHWPPGQ
jgi:predicted MFS family arabinose efflux permease